jgi:pyruvate-formate lyase-activating enzyme
MCSQPPKTANDDPLLDDAFELVRLLSPDTAELGFTGGEPTLYGERLIDLLRLCRNLLHTPPSTCSQMVGALSIRTLQPLGRPSTTQT